MHYFIVLNLILAVIMQFGYGLCKLHPAIHQLQLNSYRNLRYWHWIKKNVWSSFVVRDLLPMLALVPLVWHFTWLSMLIFAVIYLVYGILFFVTPKGVVKKPLQFTARVKRLYGFTAFLLLLISLFAGWEIYFDSRNWVWWLIGLTTLNFILPLFLLASNLLLIPIEKLINSWYLHDAKRILASIADLKIIGITGSYGKTSTKHILVEILRHKFSTLTTPGSYNTPMGICKIVRSEAKNSHQVFVAEMSAKQHGDIKEICDFVKPQWGVLTAIGPQHLDTFKSLETIIRTKNELIDALPESGVAFFNVDNEYCRKSALLTTKRVVRFGLDNQYADLDYFADNIAINSRGSSFTVHTKNGESESFQAKLLGEHNIANILASIAVAAEMGISLKDMVYPVRNLPPIEHRLQLRPGEKGCLIIDDAFNSNPVGSKMALDVLQKIDGNKKIIITPGMIELGSEQEALNREFGRAIAKRGCDFVILVGKKQSEPIYAGLMDESFSKDKLYVAEDFTHAYQYLLGIVEANDVVLLENDLPVDG